MIHQVSTLVDGHHEHCLRPTTHRSSLKSYLRKVIGCTNMYPLMRPRAHMAYTPHGAKLISPTSIHFPMSEFCLWKDTRRRGFGDDLTDDGISSMTSGIESIDFMNRIEKLKVTVETSTINTRKPCQLLPPADFHGGIIHGQQISVCLLEQHMPPVCCDSTS